MKTYVIGSAVVALASSAALAQEPAKNVPAQANTLAAKKLQDADLGKVVAGDRGAYVDNGGRGDVYIGNYGNAIRSNPARGACINYGNCC